MKKLFSRFFKRTHESIAVALLGNGIYEKIRILSVLLRRSFQHSFLQIPEDALDYAVPFHFLHNNTRFDIIPASHEEVALLYEIFCRNVYKIQLPFEPKTLLDLGANTGISTLFFHSLFPHARIIAVEPNPKIFQLLKKHLSSITNSLALHGAISNHGGEVDFFVSRQSLSSSLTQRTIDVEKIKVPSLTLRGILEEHSPQGIDLLVFDIEGAEEFLVSDRDALTHVRALLGEIHEDLMSISLEHFLSTLREIYTITIKPTQKKGRYILRGIQK